jgi:hypothetical protein
VLSRVRRTAARAVRITRAATMTGTMLIVMALIDFGAKRW